MDLSEVREMTKIHNTDTNIEWRDFDNYSVIMVDRFILEVFEVYGIRCRGVESNNIAIKNHLKEDNH